MFYIYVKWVHDLPSEPVHFYSELDADRYEVRKIEIYEDGRIGYATKEFEMEKTKLGIVPFPDLEEIASQDEFKPHIISKAEFERVWKEKVLKK